jgi:hypothetical protein
LIYWINNLTLEFALVCVNRSADAVLLIVVENIPRFAEIGADTVPYTVKETSFAVFEKAKTIS